jgi:glycerophosphoryl diester phosphodiesterase
MMTTERAWVSAHRGGAETAAAGTLLAYQDALAAGVDYIEFDVRRTADGALVVYHDKRAEKRGVRPDRLSRAELDRQVGHDVLDAADLLALARGRAKAHIDVKAPGYEEAIVTAALDAMAAADFVVTASDAVVAAIKARYPQVICALSVGRGWHEVPVSQLAQTRYSELRPVARARACGADAIAMHHTLARLGALAACSRAGLAAMVWTVNDPRAIRAFLRDSRVAVVVTDRPRLALGLRDNASGTAR